MNKLINENHELVDQFDAFQEILDAKLNTIILGQVYSARSPIILFDQYFKINNGMEINGKHPASIYFVSSVHYMLYGFYYDAIKCLIACVNRMNGVHVEHEDGLSIVLNIFNQQQKS